jgi:hypothetical protein
MTLLELILASVLMTTVVTCTAVVLRGMHAAWDAHEGDLTRLQAAHNTVRHLARKLRQASAVTAITAAGDTAGSISVTMSDSTTAIWSRSAVTSEVRYGVVTADNLLAEQITELTFIGYEADGVTATTVPGDIRSVLCQAKVTLVRDTNPTRTVACRAWLRSW